MEEHIKITELRCPSCGGILKLPDENVKSVQCEYCGNEYVFERPQQKFTPRIGPDWEPVAPQPTIQTNTLNNIWICVALFLFGIIGIVAVGRYQRTQRIKNIVLEPVPINETFHSFGENEQEEGKLSGALEQMVSVVFGKDAESVTEEELSQIQWIADKSDLDYYYIGYSFENPLENPDAKLNWLTFAAQSESGYNGLSQFRGLKRLDTKKSLSQCNLQGLQIKSLSAPIKSLEEAAEELENPELITQLTIGSQIENLQGLERFPNVQQLIINASVLNDIDAVIVLNQLKSLTLNNADVMTNFDVLASINTLEELVIESENLKALDFLKRIPQLRSLGLKDGAFLDLRELETLVELEKLAIEDCDELTDMSNVTKLLELKELLLDLPFGCAEPSLGELTKLQRLTLKKFDSCDFLSKLVNLETLTLHNCTLSSNLNLSGLTQLRKLTCASYSGDMPLNFINSLSTLEEVDLGGMVTYKDISGIFALPLLKHLDISGMECEIDFDKVSDNTSLESLEIAGIKLYENVKVSGGNGIVDVSWDDVYLVDHINFVEHFPNLKKLDIAENKIKELDFLEKLTKLEELDFSDNYVADIHILSSLSSLRQVSCKGNPIGNMRVLDETQVNIISD
ncbi:internalin-A [Lachnospiraceae bacterium]|nr:internalin-A [Lachnospiraceae bacterium]